MTDKIQNIKELKTTHWQHKRNTVGGIVADLDDIEQCYDNIFNITKGEVPLQPNLGSNIIEAVAEKPNNALLIAKTLILKDFTLQEPRGEVISVDSSYDENGKMVIEVKFKSKLTNEERDKKYYVW